jgi:hypothetical protein
LLSKALDALPQPDWRRSVHSSVYGAHSVVRLMFLPQSSLQASAPLDIAASHTPPSGAVFASLMLTRTASAEPGLALAQKLMPLYMLASYALFMAVPPSPAPADMPRSVPMPAPQVVKPLPAMHSANIPPQRGTMRASGSPPGGGVCIAPGVMSLNM